MKTYRVHTHNFGLLFVETESYSEEEGFLRFTRNSNVSAEYAAASVLRVEASAELRQPQKPSKSPSASEVQTVGAIKRERYETHLGINDAK